MCARGRVCNPAAASHLIERLLSSASTPNFDSPACTVHMDHDHMQAGYRQQHCRPTASTWLRAPAMLHFHDGGDGDDCRSPANAVKYWQQKPSADECKLQPTLSTRTRQGPSAGPGTILHQHAFAVTSQGRISSGEEVSVIELAHRVVRHFACSLATILPMLQSTTPHECFYAPKHTCSHKC